MSKYWIGVAAKNHVMIARKGGFIQLCHGKKGPLNRMKVNDKLIYYSSKLDIDDKSLYQKFTALVTVKGEQSYQVEMPNNFLPYRKNAIYDNDIREVSLKEINYLDEWIRVRSRLRFSHFEISERLYNIIYNLMKANA